MVITARAQTIDEALTEALNQLVASIGSADETKEASLALPLRARESARSSLAGAMLNELLAEIGEGHQVRSVRIDGVMNRDGDFICWGYAFAVPEPVVRMPAARSVSDVQVIEGTGQIEIRFTLDQAGA